MFWRIPFQNACPTTPNAILSSSFTLLDCNLLVSSHCNLKIELLRAHIVPEERLDKKDF